MKSLIIEAVPDSPYYPIVDFDIETGVCELSGESYMEEAYKFYQPLINWLKEYTQTGNKALEFNVRLTYFNTSSSRLILDMLDVIKRFQDSGGQAKVNWFYEKDDPDVKDEVEDFEMETGLKINLEILE